MGGLVLVGAIVGAYFLFKKGGLDGVKKDITSKKSKEASAVLNLMDKDYEYQQALKIVLRKNPKVKKSELEEELNLFI